MGNFYDGWLEMWSKSSKEFEKAKKVIYPEELKFVKTRQDNSAALLIAPETGFRTNGGLLMIARIPPGWKTGKHSHGEEAIYIVKGTGCTVIGDSRYDWEEGACVRIPFGAEHQHFNTGSETVEYLSAMTPHLEHFCGVAKFVQAEDCDNYGSLPNSLKTGNDRDQSGKRIVLHKSEQVSTKRGEKVQRLNDNFVKTMDPRMHKTQSFNVRRMMGSFEDFQGEEVEITDIFANPPGRVSQKHAHMEAILYTLQGEGYSIVDGVKYPWRPGTALHVQGPQTVHQHFSTGEKETQQLRIHFGIRKYYQPIVKPVFPYLFLEEGAD